jgi:D-xylose transport system ATP-binding protein
LRDGASVATMETKSATTREVIRRMVGRPIEDLFPRRAAKHGEPRLVVKNISVSSRSGGVRGASEVVLENVSLEVRAGEVLGIGGLMGAGRTELLMHVFGAFGKRVAGDVMLNGVRLGPGNTPSQSVRRGLVLVSEDRKRFGLVLERQIGFNMSLSSLEVVTGGYQTLSRVGLGPLGVIDQPGESNRNRSLFNALRVKAGGLQTSVGTLSGGNQQKVVIGKALLTGPSVVLLDEPTRGIDIGAKLEVYELINKLTDQGKAVVLVSSELPELMGMSDRIVMLHEGRVGGTFLRSEATQERLLAAAMGHAHGNSVMTEEAATA